MKKVIYLIFSLVFIANVSNSQNKVMSSNYSIFENTMVDMPWSEIENAKDSGAIVLISVGVIEEHGPHMSCGTDLYMAHLGNYLLKTELEKKGVKVLIAPPIYWGIADITRGFPGTFTVSKETMKSLYLDVFKSLENWGFKYAFLNNEHGEGKHNEILKEIVKEINSTMDIKAILQLNQNEAKGNEDICVPVHVPPMPRQGGGVHADGGETGIMAAIFPNLVDTLMADSLIASDYDLRNKFNTPGEAGQAWEANAREVTPLGYFGDPANYKESKKYAYDWYLKIAQNASNAITEYLKNENYTWLK
ncbi:MAG: creatininase family protein [Prolixibacteraceae bacterium]|nr:creatininase family protein [Prolixibacteraceae bacterium]